MARVATGGGVTGVELVAAADPAGLVRGFDGAADVEVEVAGYTKEFGYPKLGETAD